jgi:hypothetical protein
MIVRSVKLNQVGAVLRELVERTGQLIYPYPEFIAFLERATDTEATIILAEDAGGAVGALTYLTREQPGVGRILNSLPWYGSHGSCVVDAAGRDADAIRCALLLAFRKASDEIDVLSSTMILSHEEEAFRSLYERAIEPTTTDIRVGQVTKLPANIGKEGETLLATFEQKTRNLVRKSLKQGFEECVTDDPAAWDFLHRIHTKNIEALKGAAKPRGHFEMLRQALPPSMRRLSLAMDGDTPVAALLLLFGGRTVEYVTPSIEVGARPRQPLSFLIWNGMREAIERGFTAWNWGGTWVGQPSLHHFKAGFGAEDRHYSYLIRASHKGLAELRRQRPRLGVLFPYFYTYPFAQLDALGEDS